MQIAIYFNLINRQLTRARELANLEVANLTENTSKNQQKSLLKLVTLKLMDITN